MLKKVYCSLLLLSLFFSPVSQSASQAVEVQGFNLQHLQSLFQSYQRQAAYDYAKQFLMEMEGDPYFDYYFGVSAIDTGHASAGVFALERVLLAFPQDHVARLELARGYYILEEYARSRQEFQAVLDISPPEGVRTTADNYLDKIRLKEARYRTTSSGYVELAMGSDSNVNGGIDDDVLLAFEPDPDSLSQDDTFAAVTGSWQITHPYAPGWMFNTTVTGNIRHNMDIDQFDTLTATLQVGTTRLFKDSRYKMGLVAQQFNLDSDTYRTLAGINLDWRYSISQKSRFTTAFQYAVLDYPDQEIRNSDLLTLTLGYSHAFSGKLAPTLFSNLTIGSELAEDDKSPSALADTERDLWGLRLGAIFSLSPKLALQTAASWQNSEYGGEQTFFVGTTREDDYTTADINLLWLVNKHWRFDTRIGYTKNSSNVDIRTYDRTLISLNLNYAF